jgi:hypothetical protein
VISSPAVLPDAVSAAAANGYGPLGEVHGDLHPHVSPFPSQLILCQCVANCWGDLNAVLVSAGATGAV